MSVRPAQGRRPASPGAWPARLALLAFCVLATSWGVALVALGRPAAAQENAPDKLRVYLGTYTGSRSKGIYQGELDMKSGQLTVTGLAATTTSPSFLALHPSGKYL